MRYPSNNHYNIFVEFYVFNFLSNLVLINHLEPSECKNKLHKSVFAGSDEEIIDFLSIFVLGYPASLGRFKDTMYLQPVKDSKMIKRYSDIDILYKGINRASHFIIQTRLVPDSEELFYFIPHIENYAVNAYIKRKPWLKEVIFLAFVNDTIFPEKTEYKSTKVVFDKIDRKIDNNIDELDKKYLKKFSFTIIELPKFTPNKIEELKNNEERWLYLFKCGEDRLTKNDLETLSKDFCIELLPKISQSNDEEKTSNSSFNICRRTVANSFVDMAMLKPNNMRKILSKMKGINMIMAKNWLKEGFPVNVISKYFNVTIDDLEKVRSTLNDT